MEIKVCLSREDPVLANQGIADANSSVRTRTSAPLWLRLRNDQMPNPKTQVSRRRSASRSHNLVSRRSTASMTSQACRRPGGRRRGKRKDRASLGRYVVQIDAARVMSGSPMELTKHRDLRTPGAAPTARLGRGLDDGSETPAPAQLRTCRWPHHTCEVRVAAGIFRHGDSRWALRGVACRGMGMWAVSRLGRGWEDRRVSRNAGRWHS